MLKKDKIGMTIKDHKEYSTFLKKLKELNINIEKDFIPYTRHTHFIPDGCPSCDVCGGNKLIHGMGRYIVFDSTGEIKTNLFLCGYCINFLEEMWGLKLDYM